MEVFAEIADGARAESQLWAAALRPDAEREPVAVFSRLAPAVYAVGLETVYEAYLVHYGLPRLFATGEESERVLLGDYLYAHGLVRVAETGDVGAVADLAELISLCAQARADGRSGDGQAWAATAACLGAGDLDDAREALRLEGDPVELEALARRSAGDAAVDEALAAHARLVL